LNEPISSLKESLTEIIQNSSVKDMKLFQKKDDSSNALIDETLVTENGIKDDDVLFLILRNGNDWETMDIVEPE
jgi:hypothetical protein